MQQSRSEYIKEYKELMSKLPWEENLPQVTDLLKLFSGKETRKINKIFKFFGETAEEELKNQLHQKDKISEEDSKNFIDKVMTANVTEIKDAGSFFKQAMASAGDVTITIDDCKSPGKAINIRYLDESDFNYHIKDSYFTLSDRHNAKKYITNSYEEFRKITKDIKTIWVRNPFSCKCGPEHFCNKCVGKIPEQVVHIGAFAALMVTEFNTQAQLSSMNKGVKSTINSILSQQIDAHSYEDFIEQCEKIIDDMQGDVESRWYQIVLSSRWRNGKVYSMSSPYSENLFGKFLYSAKQKNFTEMADTEVFDDNSLKVQIMLNNYIDKRNESNNAC